MKKVFDVKVPTPQKKKRDDKETPASTPVAKSKVAPSTPTTAAKQAAEKSSGSGFCGVLVKFLVIVIFGIVISWGATPREQKEVIKEQIHEYISPFLEMMKGNDAAGGGPVESEVEKAKRDKE